VRLWREAGVRVLPGGYLGREVGGVNPGREYIRVALVAAAAEVERGLAAIRAVLADV
jgi:aspartate/methionine/tyrosine aminotransferase